MTMLLAPAGVVEGAALARLVGAAAPATALASEELPKPRNQLLG